MFFLGQISWLRSLLLACKRFSESHADVLDTIFFHWLIRPEYPGKRSAGNFFPQPIWCAPPLVNELTERTPAQIVRHLQFSYMWPGAIFVSYGSRDEENSTNFSPHGRSRAFFSAEYTFHLQTSLQASWMCFRVDFPAGPLSFSLKSPPTVLKQFQPEVSMRR